MVALVQYPNCTAYEGRKVVVFYCCDIKTARKWKRLDPHFSDPKRHDPSDVEVAPPPDGRFPATDQGWSDAVMLARLKQ